MTEKTLKLPAYAPPKQASSAGLFDNAGKKARIYAFKAAWWLYILGLFGLFALAALYSMMFFTDRIYDILSVFLLVVLLSNLLAKAVIWRINALPS